ncbi:hypothetical protein, partial [Nonomuraea antimicrobica]|uniref:hypothetical protein n=1 Tax=Nonomuraea antimicrobica TaxID=561173 RepID=UPI0031E7FA31
MRIMLTVIGGQGDRDVVIDGDDGVTVARLSEALGDQGPLAEVVRLPKARAPYGMTAAGPVPRAGTHVGAHAVPRVPRPRRPERPGRAAPTLWRDGRA